MARPRFWLPDGPAASDHTCKWRSAWDFSCKHPSIIGRNAFEVDCSKCPYKELHWLYEKDGDKC